MKLGHLSFAYVALFSCLVIGAVAVAQPGPPQPQQPPPSALERALNQRLTAEIGASLSCNRDLIALNDAATQIQSELAAAKGKIVELEAKLAGK